MPGTKLGGLKAAETNKKKYGKDFYAKIGAMGGKKATDKPKGFAANLELARLAGRKGGLASKRRRIYTEEQLAARKMARYYRVRIEHHKKRLSMDLSKFDRERSTQAIKRYKKLLKECEI